MSTLAHVPGLDLDRLLEWLVATVPNVRGPLSAQRISGGKSNLTYEVSDQSTTWIVRRPPLGHVLETAHDMARECRVMTALGRSRVPVPKTYGYCADRDVLGAPFYVMERVPGRPYRYAAELGPLGSARASAISAALVDTLAELHAVVPAEFGLEDFGRSQGYLARQVRRWKQQLDASLTRELPTASDLHARLSDATPVESAVAIVHGDYRLDNVLFDENDRLTAVIDWEMATLGDPLADLGMMLVYGRLAETSAGAAVGDVSTTPGYLAEHDIMERYARASGRDLSDIGFYLALASFKIAAILEGIHFRYLQGQTVGEGFDRVGEAVEPLLEGGLAAMEDLS